MMGSIRRTIFSAVLATYCVTAAAADTFPGKSIRLIIPYPAGGITDILARSLQEPLRKTLGQSVIVENKPGASGAIGAQLVAHAAADGYTLLLSNTALSSIVPFVQKDVGFDPVKDFAPVSLVSTSPVVLVANPGAPFADVAGLISYARSRPTKVEYGSAGVGSMGHLASELLAHSAGLKLLHVPYGGMSPSTMAVMTGEVQVLMTASSGTLNNYLAAGKLKLLGVSAPSKLYPKAQAIGDVLPGFSAEYWFGIFAPAGTPPEVVARLNGAIASALAQPKIAKTYEDSGAVVTPSTPGQLAEVLKRDVAKWSALVKINNITSE
jgi:tripartite-type tricarboxylate transporter receptor subunit TctC